MQVIIGPESNDGLGPWYFSLNNRRLWVLKRCREEGLLDNNVIKVRVRDPKSDAEAERYSVENCALEAKIMQEPGKRNGENGRNKVAAEGHSKGTSVEFNAAEKNLIGGIEACHLDGRQSLPQKPLEHASSREGESSSDEDDNFVVRKNPFSALA